MKLKTSELTGAALDWAVDKAEGREWNTYAANEHPSTDWAQGGPIIAREKINFEEVDGTWHAELEYLPDDDAHYRYGMGQGPTHLIAAMRCYVASKLGDEVDVPEELMAA